MFETYEINTFKGQNQWLSNMAPIQAFIVDGISYNTVENFYQAQKTLAVGRRLQMSKMNPYDSKAWGKALTLRSDWNDIKDDVMKQGLEIKFSQPRFYNLLANTGIYELVEGNHHGDMYWGVCLKTKKGKNKLGQFITEIRSRIFEELDNTEMLIDKYPNIRRELANFDYKHMDKSTIRFLQNEFIKNTYELDALKIIDELFETVTYEQIMEEVMSQEFHKQSLSDKMRVSLIGSNLIDFVSRFKDYLNQTQLTVKIK